jgi:hypothetical protein
MAHPKDVGSWLHKRLGHDTVFILITARRSGEAMSVETTTNIETEDVSEFVTHWLSLFNEGHTQH